MGVGTDLGVALDNIPIGVSIGAGCGMLLFVVSIFETEKNK